MTSPLDDRRFKTIMDGVIEAIREMRAKIEVLSKTLDTLAEAVVNTDARFGDMVERKEKLVNVKLQQHFNEQKQETKTITKVQEDIIKNIDNLERKFLLPSLIIRGIPKYQNEDLYHYITSISKHLSFTPSVNAITNLFRAPSRGNGRGSPAIIITFTSTKLRTEFYIKYLQKKDLSLKHLNFAGDSRIYISECLSKRNVYILKVALQLKKNKQIHTAYTKNGRVFVRETCNQSIEILVDDVTNLNKYSISHPNQRTSTTHTSASNQLINTPTTQCPPPPAGQILVTCTTKEGESSSSSSST